MPGRQSRARCETAPGGCEGDVEAGEMLSLLLLLSPTRAFPGLGLNQEVPPISEGGISVLGAGRGSGSRSIPAFVRCV